MTKSNSPKESHSGIDRRKTPRRPILSTFSVFIVIPKKGFYRLAVYDISEEGVGFEMDVEGESPSHFPIKNGENIEFRLYLNQSLYVPLTAQITRLEETPTGRRAGAELQDKGSSGHKAFLAFLDFLDKIANLVEIDSN